MLRNGVVVAEFYAPNKFKFYNSGVLTDEEKPSTINQRDAPADSQMI